MPFSIRLIVLRSNTGHLAELLLLPPGRTREQFRDVYGSVFPGARFDDLGFALAMVWTAPASGEIALMSGFERD
ncbi:hypothetical protein [Nonomuraea rubra]|uniref:Uncharacterized protein n=1 Tax=Nonomuraea rubra TaxID=46180 RepID=A0A7X0NXQ1_9ACTN|nr:hypothetical protein [Nonomuraea rubra]MBB6551540.1 hypothetical protein [Nonomuraea rubra]